MSREIIVITPTGDRNFAFSLSRKWMRHQTVKPTKWIVVDDGKRQMLSWDMCSYTHYIRREPLDTDPKFTLVINVARALEDVGQCSDDTIFIFWEDDEYYAPTYIEEMCNRIEKYDVLGMGCAKYYHLPTGGYAELRNMHHASLAQTAFKATALPIINQCIDLGMELDWLDCNIWKQAKMLINRLEYKVFKDEKYLYAGMKGLPGRLGIGVGHRPDDIYKTYDLDQSILKLWTGVGAQEYLSLKKECYV